MSACSAYGCTNRPSKKIPGITFHCFPKNEERRTAWVKAVRRKNWVPSKCSTLCSEHFTEDQLDRTSLCCVRLRENAVPTIFKTLPSGPQKGHKRKMLLPDGENLATDFCEQMNMEGNPNVKKDNVAQSFSEDTNIQLNANDEVAKREKLLMKAENLATGCCEQMNMEGNPNVNKGNVAQSFSEDTNVQLNADDEVPKREKLLMKVENLATSCCEQMNMEGNPNVSKGNVAQSFSEDTNVQLNTNDEARSGEAVVSSPVKRELKKKLKMAEGLNVKYRKKIKILQQKVRRLGKKVENLTSALNELKKNTMEEDVPHLTKTAAPNIEYILLYHLK